MSSPLRPSYEPHLAYVEDGQWFGIDLIHLGDRLVGTRISIATSGQPVHTVGLSLPRAFMSLELTAERFGKFLRPVADAVVDALVAEIYIDERYVDRAA